MGLRSQEAVVASRVVEVAAEDVGKWITSARLLARNLPALCAPAGTLTGTPLWGTALKNAE